jgi:hypothetical protein
VTISNSLYQDTTLRHIGTDALIKQNNDISKKIKITWCLDTLFSLKFNTSENALS